MRARTLEKMKMKILVVCLSFLELYISFVAAQGEPYEYLSYRALGEIIVHFDPGDTVVWMFEENFDYDNRQAAFEARSAGFVTTLIEDMNLNQTFKYDEVANEDGKIVKTCQIGKPTDWRKVHIPPDLELLEKSNETLYFPMMQLLWGLSPDRIKPGTEVENIHYRDIPCEMWRYQLNYTTGDISQVVEIEAYWSNGEWNMSAKENTVPIGFIIHHNGVNRTSGQPIKVDQYVNVMLFTEDHFNKEALLPKEGVYCPGRKSLKPFPSFGGFEAVSASIEFQWEQFNFDSNVDMRIDATNKLVQVHYDPMNQPPNILNRKVKVPSTLISSFDKMIAYDIRGESCKVMSATETEDDVQTLYDIQELSELTTDRFFGQGIKYVYIGETVKRGIPCHLWQGQRRGWPKSEPSITTVWEWCFAERVGNPIVLQDYAIPVINLDITVTESHLTAAMGAYTLGTKFSYDFYQLINRKPSYLKALDFDISPCFNDSYKIWLQFKVDVKSLRQTLKNATANADFLDAWRENIYGETGIRPTSLRIPKVKTILADSTLFVQFLILERHPDTPAFITKDANLEQATSRLKAAVDGGAVSIDWQNNILKAEKGSLGPIFENGRNGTSSTSSSVATEEATTISTVTPSKTQTENTLKTSETSSKIPSSESQTTSSSPVTSPVVTDAPEAQMSRDNPHSPGTMAGVGISMLILGLSLGAGGTFAKFRYFPSLW